MTRDRLHPMRLHPIAVEGGPSVDVLAMRVVRHLLLRPAWDEAFRTHLERPCPHDLADPQAGDHTKYIPPPPTAP